MGKLSRKPYPRSCRPTPATNDDAANAGRSNCALPHKNANVPASFPCSAWGITIERNFDINMGPSFLNWVAKLQGGKVAEYFATLQLCNFATILLWYPYGAAAGSKRVKSLVLAGAHACTPS